MSTTININVTGAGEPGDVSGPCAGTSANCADLQRQIDELSASHGELVDQMGEDIAPFPDAGIDGFLSHFIITIQFLKGDLKGRIISLSMPPSMQTVSRSAPFIYQGAGSNHSVQIPLPGTCTLAGTIHESDFLIKPNKYFEAQRETVWMQILHLDSRMDSDFGPIRIVLGETLKREYPDIFQPSHGVAQSLGKRGFPAKLFFNPYAIIETNFGNFRAIHGTLAYGRIIGFPPIGTPVTITECVPMEAVEDVRAKKAIRGVDTTIEPYARIIALSHPIDMSMRISGEEAFGCIEECIAGKH